MDRRLRVFVSSTVKDFGEVRKQIKSSLEEDGTIECFLSDAADFPVEPGLHSHEACLAAVRNAHVLVLLVGSRFGGEYLEQNKSITWREWEESCIHNLVPIILIKKDTNELAQKVAKAREGLSGALAVPEQDAQLREQTDFEDDRSQGRQNIPGVQRFIDLLRKGHVDNWVHLDWDGTSEHAMKFISNRLTSAHASAESRVRQLRHREADILTSCRGLSEFAAVAAQLAGSKVKKEKKRNTLWDLLGMYANPLFGLQPRDLFKLSFYELEGAALQPSLVKTNHSLNSTDRSRSWKVGVGHVGLCVAQNRTLVSGDIRQSTAWVKAAEQPGDTEKYVSSISVPISLSNSSPDAALVLTSSRLDHFRDLRQAEVLTLEAVASILKIVMRG